MGVQRRRGGIRPLEPHLSAGECVPLISVHSDHTVLEEHRRERLLEDTIKLNLHRKEGTP